MPITVTRQLLVGAALATATGVAAIRVVHRRGQGAASVADEARRIRELYDRGAARYDSIVRIPERILFGDGRMWAAAQASGDVLEIAVGTGRNVPHYGFNARITGQDISTAMLKIARTRAQALGRDIGLQVSDAQDLASQADVSTAWSAHSRSIPDDRRALKEAWRVLSPNGRLILLEHVRSPQPVVRLLQGLLEPLAIRYAGDHLLRDPLDHLGSLGFSVEYCARSRAGIVERLVARKIHQHVISKIGGHHDA